MYDIAAIKKGFDLLGTAMTDTELRQQGHYFVGSCPWCGGKDRFVVKPTSDGDLWICRNCAPDKYHDAIEYVMRRERVSFLAATKLMCDGRMTDLDEEIVLERKRKMEEMRAERQAKIDARIADLTTHEVWEALHRRLENDHRAWWRKAGVPDDWQDYLCLGYIDKKGYYSKDNALHYSPAYSIPYFHYDADSQANRRFVTMQYRLVDTSDPNDRYRFEQGVGSSFFMVEPTMPIGDKVIVCEGAKKGIVARVYGKLKGFTVLSVPSKSDAGHMIEKVKQCGRVWLILDPDATNRTFALAQSIGCNSRVVEIPMKLDDAILRGFLSPMGLARYMAQAVKV